MRARRMLTFLVVPLMLGLAACRAEPEAPEDTPTPTPQERPEVQLEGTVRVVLEATDFSAIGTGTGTDTGRDDTADDTADESPAARSPGATTAPGRSPAASPSATDDDDDDPQASGGGVVVQASGLSESLEECGYDVGDNVPVFWEDTDVFEGDVADDEDFPANLSGERITVVANVEQLAGQCVLLASSIEVDEDASPAATVRPGASPAGRATASPAARSTARPTSTPDETP